MKLLTIEDDREAANYLCRGLTECGHVVDHAEDGETGLQYATERHYDVLIVDRMLPKLDGLSVISQLREQQIDTPVLVLSGLGEVDDRVEGLRVGGDDYLVKPYAFNELLARLDALQRRASQVPQTLLKVADLELDRLKHKVSRAGKSLHLQPREFRLLEYLMRHAGQVVTRTMLLEQVWNYHFDPQTNVVDVHISRLRGKIDRGFEPTLLHTVRGMGYSLRLPE